MDNFSTRLKDLLAEKSMTQKEFCTELKLSKNQVHYWLKNKANPDLDTLVLIAKYFKVTTDFLLGVDNNS